MEEREEQAAREQIEGMEERAKQMEQQLAVPLLAAALLTIPAIAIEQSDAGQPWDTIAVVMNWVIWLAFLSEVVLMMRVVDVLYSALDPRIRHARTTG